MIVIVSGDPIDYGLLTGDRTSAAGNFLKAALSQVGIEWRDAQFFSLFSESVPDIKPLCGKQNESIPGTYAVLKGKYLKAEYGPTLRAFWNKINYAKPTVIIALGSLGQWAVTGESNMKNFRGTFLEGLSDINKVKVISTYTPQAVFKEWKVRPVFFADLEKAAKNSTFSEIRRPRRSIFIEPTYDDLLSFEAEYITPSPWLSIDIETSGRAITCLSIAPSPTVSLVIPFLMNQGRLYWKTLEEEVRVWEWIKRICALDKCAVFQNGMYDMHHLWRNYGIPVMAAANGEDSMLLHHALQPEMEKGLRFLGSIYTQEQAWKFMGRRNVDTIKRED